jgi:hypothetical protein
MGVGIIARDHMGNVLASKCSVQQYVSDPTIAEAIGAWQGAKLGRDMGLQSIVLECDSKEIVLALGRVDYGLGKYGSIIVVARKLLTGFQSWAVIHVRREGNGLLINLQNLLFPSS